MIYDLKEMLSQHKPISEETSAIEDIWGETVADGAEDSIRGWEDQINELENKIGEKYE